MGEPQTETHPEATLGSLPSEILLEIFSEIQYTPALRSNLRSTSRRFHEVTDKYGPSIAGKILKTQFPWAKRQFPGLLGKNGLVTNNPGWEELADVFHRISILSSIKSRCRDMRQVETEHSAWTTCRAMTFHHTGLLLLYRLADCATHQEKVELIQSLPISSLAIILFTLMVSVHILRALGPPSANFFDPPITNEQHLDIELACEELFLRDGPEFLFGLLMHDSSRIETLKKEISSMDAKQHHHPSDPSRPPELTLIASLRRAFAAAANCEIRYNLVHMWYVLDERCAALSDPRQDERTINDAVERIVNGEELEVPKCARCRMLELYGF